MKLVLEEEQYDKKIERKYLVCFDSKKLQDSYLASFPAAEDAIKFAKDFNSQEPLTKEYGFVHVEKRIITTEILQAKVK